ncbi:flagellin N-terminal helical domain-containing protein [Devosia riboflavina]
MGSDVSLSKAVRANLLSLQNTAGMMDKTQNRLATGNKVNSALDNPSSFFTASALNSRAADMSNLLNSMASGIKVIEAANNGITALTKNLESMQSTLRQARQDKSFQTKSFEINDNTKINLAGGQFGDLGSEISLATATVPGVKSELTTAATTAYLGPQSTTASASGAGARSVISLAGGFAQNDVFSVAGVDVTVTDAAPDAANIAADIQTALAGDAATAGKYTVSVGAAGSGNDGKIIIESVDTSAAAAAINFDPDSDPLTGVGAAVKGTTEFNYSAVPGSINVAGQNIATGANFADFVKNLESGAKAGKYTVDADATTGKIKLTNTEYGASVPAVTGIPTAVAGSASVDTLRRSRRAPPLATLSRSTMKPTPSPLLRVALTQLPQNCVAGSTATLRSVPSMRRALPPTPSR